VREIFHKSSFPHHCYHNQDALGLLFQFLKMKYALIKKLCLIYELLNIIIIRSYFNETNIRATVRIWSRFFWPEPNPEKTDTKNYL